MLVTAKASLRGLFMARNAYITDNVISNITGKKGQTLDENCHEYLRPIEKINQ